MGEKNLNIGLSGDEFRRFEVFCTQLGAKKKTIGAAALVLMQHAPADLREMALRGDPAAVAAWFDRASATGLEAKLLDVLERVQKASSTPKPARPR